MINNQEYYIAQEAAEHFRRLKNSFKGDKLTEEDQQEIFVFLEYAEKFVGIQYLALAIKLVSNQKYKLGNTALFKVYDLILTNKKLHPLLPRVIFPNWILFMENRPEAIDLLFMYLGPQKIKINKTVHESVLIHYGSNFNRLNNRYQNRIFEYCLINDCENRLLLKVYANHYPFIRSKLRERFMEKIMLDNTIKNNYYHTFLTDLMVFNDLLQKQILERISEAKK